MQHIFKYNEKYYLLESKTSKFYKIPSKFNRKLDSQECCELDTIAENIHLEDLGEKYTLVENDLEVCNRLVLNLTDQCNLACKYCYAEGGDYGQNNPCAKMNCATLEKAVKMAFALFPKGIRQIQFFGGEPLVNKKVLKYAIEYIKRMANDRCLESPIFTMVTNGILIDEDMIDLFNQEFTSVTISVDGSKEVNDSMRVFWGGEGSVFDTVSEVIQKIHQSEKKFYLCIEGTIHDAHIREFEETKDIQSYYALKELEPDIIHISPMISNDTLDVRYKDFFREWVIKEIDDGIDNVKTKSVASLLYAAKERKVYGNGCGAVYTDLAIDVIGNIYPCFMFIGSEVFKIGHVDDSVSELFVNNGKIRKMLSNANENETCNRCWVKPMCSKSYGHCIGARYLATKSIEKPKSEFCDISKCVLETAFAESYERYRK